MSQRIIVFDTETTGMNKIGNDPSEGHRIIEIGCVEIIDRQPTQNYLQLFINPEQKIDPEAMKVHGITDEKVQNEPTFKEILPKLLDYLEGADELVAHNMSFDQSFLNREWKLAGLNYRLEDKFILTDSLELAKNKFPGQRNNLDILCKRFAIDNSQRDLHGALLDSQLLAEVYLKLTAEQKQLDFTSATTAQSSHAQEDPAVKYSLSLAGEWLAATVSDSEKQAHAEIMERITPKS